MKRPLRPPMKKAAAAGALLDGLLQQWGFAEKLRAHQAWQVWDEVVGPQIAAHAQPVRVRDGILEVRVDQAVWMQQLQLMKPKILARLCERTGGDAIRDIFWKRGNAPEKPTAVSTGNERPWLERALDESERDRIEEVLAPLGDGELRDRLRALLQRQAQLDKTLRST